LPIGLLLERDSTLISRATSQNRSLLNKSLYHPWYVGIVDLAHELLEKEWFPVSLLHCSLYTFIPPGNEKKWYGYCSLDANLINLCSNYNAGHLTKATSGTLIALFTPGNIISLGICLVTWCRCSVVRRSVS
jgi:hypothetical protein